MSNREPADPEDYQTATGNVEFSSASARLPEGLGLGVFSTGVILLGAGQETVLDFLQGLGGRKHIVTRVVLPNRVVGQLVRALEQNQRDSNPASDPPPQESTLEANPRKAKGQPSPSSTLGAITDQPAELHPSVNREQPHPTPTAANQEIQSPESSEHQKSQEQPADQKEPPVDKPNHSKANSSLSQNGIQDIYDELQLPDSLMAGSFANKVIVRNTGAECVLDFVSQLFPKPCVSARVIMAAERTPALVHSLKQHMATNRLR